MPENKNKNISQITDLQNKIQKVQTENTGL